jgi:hypothetical protein
MSLACAALIAGSVSYFVPPESLPFGACAFKRATGFSCLSCGMTRSFHAAACGELGEALRFHPLGPILLAGILFVGAIAGGEAVAGRTLAARPPKRTVVRIAAVLGSGWLLFGVVRAVIEYMKS